MKSYRVVRYAIYLLIALFILILNKGCLNHLNLLVGLSMLFLSIDDFLGKIIKKELSNEKVKIVDDLLVFTLGVIVLFLKVNTQFSVICIIWAVWTILREEWEIREKVFNKETHKIVAILSLIESIVVIAFSITLIFNLSVHHAKIHVIILGIEYILVVLFPLLNGLLVKNNQNKDEKEA